MPSTEPGRLGHANVSGSVRLVVTEADTAGYALQYISSLLQHSPRWSYIQESEMSDIQRYGEEFQKVGKNGFDASVRSLGELGKGFQAIRASMIDYTKKSFEDGTRVFEQLAGAKSIAQASEFDPRVRQESLRSLRGPGIEDRRDVRPSGS